MSILHSIIVTIAMLSIIGSTLMVPLIYIDFEVRRDYIAKVLCINQDQPITTCGGKCYLNNRLRSTTKQQEHNSITSLNKIHISFFKERIFQVSFDSSLHALLRNYLVVQGENPCNEFPHDIFHPPQVTT